MLDVDGDSDAKKYAVDILANPQDAVTLEFGIVALFRSDLRGDGTLHKFKQELQHLCSSEDAQKVLGTLQLNFHAQFKMTKEVPDLLLRICAKTQFYDLTGNSFRIPRKSYLHQLVERTTR
jgi:hypothetical protein